MCDNNSRNWGVKISIAIMYDRMSIFMVIWDSKNIFKATTEIIVLKVFHKFRIFKYLSMKIFYMIFYLIIQINFILLSILSIVYRYIDYLIKLICMIIIVNIKDISTLLHIWGIPYDKLDCLFTYILHISQFIIRSRGIFAIFVLI